MNKIIIGIILGAASIFCANYFSGWSPFIDERGCDIVYEK